jgi:hypothetical protein
MMATDEGVFPVRVVHLAEPDISDEICMSAEELAIELEFYDEFSKYPVEVWSASSRVQRVICHALRLRLCRTVPRRPTLTDLSLSACRGFDGTLGVAETCFGAVHRVLLPSGPSLPLKPLEKVDCELVQGQVDMSMREFFEEWISRAAR